MENRKIHEAMGHLDPMLVQAAEERRVQKKNWLRPLAVVACLALMVAIPVGAAVKNFVIQYLENEKVLVENRDHIPVEAFSEELQEKVAELGVDADYDACTMTFSAWTEAEAFLGVDLLENPVLDGREVRQMYNDAGELEAHDPIRMHLAIAPWGLASIDMDAVYRINKVHIMMFAILYTEEGGGAIGFSHANPPEGFTVPEYGVPENRTSAGGKPYTVQFGEDSASGARAQTWLNCNGATVWLHFSGYDEGTLRTTVQQVMDGFQ